MFAEQIAFFLNKGKLKLPTERYDDITKGAHDRAFMVAGAAKADLLNDIHRAIEARIKDGKGLDAFTRDFRKIVADHGWTGWTGEGSKKGQAWRARVIWKTNLRTSYAAGRHKQMTDPAHLAVAPYWQYVHSHNENARKEHKKWGDMKLTLRHDHPFWKTHKPPNGYGCGCTFISTVEPDKDAATTPPKGWDRINPATGTPYGVDKGWDYDVGANTEMPLRQMLQDKLVTYPKAISTLLLRDLRRWVDANSDPADFARKALANPGLQQDLWLGFAPAALAAQAGVDISDYFILLPTNGVQHVEIRHGQDKGKQRAPVPEDFRHASRWLHEGKVTRSNRTGDRGETRLDCVWKNEAGEEVVSHWEVRTGSRNRALALITCYIKR